MQHCAVLCPHHGAACAHTAGSLEALSQGKVGEFALFQQVLKHSLSGSTSWKLRGLWLQRFRAEAWKRELSWPKFPTEGLREPSKSLDFRLQTCLIRAIQRWVKREIEEGCELEDSGSSGT